MRKLVAATSMAALALGILVEVAAAMIITVRLPMTRVIARDSERGSFYAIALDLPPDVTAGTLDRVQLEFTADVIRTSAADSAATAAVGVYPLRQALGDAPMGVAAAQFNSAVASVRPVRFGEHQPMKLDITETVRSWLVAPSSNYGLVIGTLTGPAVGTISLRDSSLGPNTAVRVTYLYKTRFGERISSRK